MYQFVDFISLLYFIVIFLPHATVTVLKNEPITIFDRWSKYQAFWMTVFTSSSFSLIWWWTSSQLLSWLPHLASVMKRQINFQQINIKVPLVTRGSVEAFRLYFIFLKSKCWDISTWFSHVLLSMIPKTIGITVLYISSQLALRRYCCVYHCIALEHYM